MNMEVLETITTTELLSKQTIYLDNIIEKIEKANYIIPIKTSYEKDGFLMTTEGRLRKYYKAVTAPSKLTSLDSFFLTLLRAEKNPTY